MLVNAKKLLEKAKRGKYAVAHFNINNMEILQAIVAGAAAEKAPVIIATSEGAIKYAGMDYLLSLAHLAAKKHNIPIAIALDHGKNFKLVKLAIKSGYSAVMFDGSLLPYKENVKKTKQVVSLAKKRNVSVEAELGAIFGVEDLVSVSEKQAFFTDPDQAADFVTKTKCDALAVSVGTSHGAYKFKGDSKLDMARLKDIAIKTKIPLVLHGASGIPPALIKKLHKQCNILGDCNRLSGAKGLSDSSIKTAIKHGVSKINIDSDLRIAFTASVRQSILDDHQVFDPRKLLGPARDLMTQVVRQKIKLLGSSGKAK